MGLYIYTYMYRYKYREIVGINDMLMECSWNTRDMMWEALAAIFPTMTGNGFCCTHSNHDPGDDLWHGVYHISDFHGCFDGCDHIMNDFLT